MVTRARPRILFRQFLWMSIERDRQIQIETDRDRQIETDRQTDRDIKIERDRERQIPGYTHTHQPSVYNVQQKIARKLKNA